MSLGVGAFGEGSLGSLLARDSAALEGGYSSASVAAGSLFVNIPLSGASESITTASATITVSVPLNGMIENVADDHGDLGVIAVAAQLFRVRGVIPHCVVKGAIPNFSARGVVQ